MSKFYISTSIAYTNANPHIGFAMEMIQADCLARYHRMIGDEVFYTTGTDEHGMKMAQAARDQGKTPQELADQNAGAFQRAADFLHISYDDFIRTTQPRHLAGTAKIWKRIAAAGDFYKNTYEGLYCVGCEAYITEKDLVNGNCPNHHKPPEHFSEENYFFKYTKYIPQIKKLITEGTLRVVPDSRKLEILNLLDSALKEKKDISFSRPANILSWGIPVPDDPTQTMYVWCDALSNYVTAIDFAHEGALFEKWWPNEVNLIGKDILRFHAGFWIAMLLSAKMPIPKAIYVHGYVTAEGQKMSKSLGNVVDPFEIGKKYGVDPLRFFLLREIPTTDDGDFSQARFEAIYNSELANNLGNLVSRVLAMNEKYNEGKVPAVSKNDAIVHTVLSTWKEYQQHIQEFNLKAAAEDILGLLMCANKYIDDKKPWELAKKEPVAVLQVLYHLLEIIRHASFMLLPFIPETAEKIQKILRVENQKLYPDGIAWGGLKEGTSLGEVQPLFPRLAASTLS